MKRSLTKRERLSNRSDLKRVFTSRKVECKGLKLLFVENELSWNRIVVCPVRRFKKAVDRNREKRVFREIYRTKKGQIRGGYDIAFIIYPGLYSFSDRCKQVSSLFKQAGLKQ